MKEKVLAAMSGGFDSASAALLLKENTVCEGAVMRLFVPAGKEETEGERDAEAVCRALGIGFHLFDMRDEFANSVMDTFAEAYTRGETPNPCIVCNRDLKFGLFLERARDMGFSKIATGHYAKVEKSGGRYVIKKGESREKDQSYVLWCLTQDQLSSVMLPLGTHTKAEVREMTEAAGLPVAHKSESQDICFVPDGDYAGFIKDRLGRDFPAGDFTDTDGNVLGRHKGIIHYTVGQRRGLGLSLKAPLYVKKKDTEKNRVILCPDAGLYEKSLDCRMANWVACDTPSAPLRVEAKIRYRHEAAKATAWATGEGEFHLEFDEPQRAISPGQSCVLYDGDILVGGGIIE